MEMLSLSSVGVGKVRIKVQVEVTHVSQAVALKVPHHSSIAINCTSIMSEAPRQEHTRIFIHISYLASFQALPHACIIIA